MSRIKTYDGVNQYEFVVRGQADLVRQALAYDFDSIIDVGAGNLAAARAFHQAGKQCAGTVNNPDLYGVNKLTDGIKIYKNIDVERFRLAPWRKFDAVWFAHVLEHTLNPGMALRNVRRLLKPNGLLFLMIPPFKHKIVGGHVSIGWNLGLLNYFLILSGFNVREGEFIHHGHNLACFVRKGVYPDVRLRGDRGDIEALSHLFHPMTNAKQGFNGNLQNIGWKWRIKPEYEAPDTTMKA